MSIVHFDGFDMYGSGIDIDARGYTSINTHTFDTGRDGAGLSVKLAATTGAEFRVVRPLPAATDTLTVGFAFRCSTVSGYQTGKGIYLMYASGTGTFLGEVQVSNTGVLQYKTPGGSAAIVSAAGAIIANNFYYIELALTRNSSTGSAELWLDGVSVGTATGINTGSQAIESIVFYGDSQAGANQWYDDLYIKDTIGALGPVRCQCFAPNADTSDADFTPSTGTDHFACVDDIPVNADTDYVYADTAGDMDIYALAGFSLAAPTTIHAVQACMVARKDDASARTARTKLVSGSTTANGATQTMTGSYLLAPDMYPLDPDTAAAWTVTGINALKAGIEVVS